MRQILLIVSSPRSESYSTRIARILGDKLLRQDPASRLTVRDLAANPPPHIDDAFETARNLPPEQLTPEQRSAIHLSDILLEELLEADVIIIASHMINFGIPSNLKAYIDHIVRPGVAFRCNENGPEGLLKGKTTYLVVSRDGVYARGPKQSCNFQDTYLRTVLGFIGLTEIELVAIEGIALGPGAAEAAFSAALAHVTTLVENSQDPAVDYDPHLSTVEDSYALYARLQEKCPVAHSNALGGFYMVTRYDDVQAAVTDWQRFSSAQGVAMPRNISGGRLMAIEMDPPEQAPWRKLYTDAVTPAALEKFEPKLAALANSVIDAFAAKGECDLVRDFAEPLPVLAVCDLIGLTGKDPTIIRDLAYEFTTNISDSVHRQDSDARMAQFIVGELMARRAAPRDDYLTRIALAEIDGRRMNESELMLFMTGFLVAGHETTTSALTSLLFCSLSQPELGARMLEDQKALAAGIEEALRLHAPFHGFTRTTTVPVEIAGVIVGADEPIRLCYAAANRDPTKFDHPDKFDIDRPKRMHFAFGGGRHACAGAPLARMEMRVAFRELLRRLPGIALVEKLLERDFVGGLLAAPRSLTATFPR